MAIINIRAFYYMYANGQSDGEVHRYFTHFENQAAYGSVTRMWLTIFAVDTTFGYL